MLVKFLRSATIDAKSYVPGDVASFDTARGLMYIREHTGESVDPAHDKVREIYIAIRETLSEHDAHDLIADLLVKADAAS